MSLVIARIKGGLGNQLFCYAAARRLALANNAELAIDAVTGFARDSQYLRQYSLDHFQLPIRKATPAERMEPFGLYRRKIAKLLSGRKPFEQRSYLEQEGVDFDARLLSLKVSGSVYLDGYWQSEGYFKDVEQTLREDLKIIPPEDSTNRSMAREILQSNAVALHVRWFDPPGNGMSSHNAAKDYYLHALEVIKKQVEDPRFFLFSDDPGAAQQMLGLSGEQVTCMNHNLKTEDAYADLWLMAQCKHFIIANSTFSWWGAWLSDYSAKVVIVPDIKINGIMSWGFAGLIPDKWIQLA